MFRVLRNAWVIPDLRKKILYTLLMLLITAASLGFIITVGGSLMESYSLSRLEETVDDNADEIKFGRDGLDVGDDFEPYAGGAYTLVYSGAGLLLHGRVPPGFNPGEPFLEGEPYIVACPGGDFYLYDRRLDGGALWLRGVLPVSAVGGFPLIAARLAFFILPLLALLAAGGGYLIARRAFLPIERIIAAADAISEGRDLSARIGLTRYTGSPPPSIICSDALRPLLRRRNSSPPTPPMSCARRRR